MRGVDRTKEVIGVQETVFEEAPYDIVPFIPVKDGVYGVGIPALILKLQAEINTRTNQSLDANTMGLYCMIAANMRFIKNEKDLAIRKNGVIRIKHTDKPLDQIIQFLRPPVEFVQVAENYVGAARSDIARTTRLKGVASGDKISPNPTATEMNSMMREVLKSLRLIFKRLNAGIFSNYLEWAYKMIIRHRVQSLTIELNGTWQTISVKEIYTDGIDIHLLGTTHMEDELVRRNQAMQLFDLTMKAIEAGAPMQNEAGEQVMPDLYKSFKDVLVTFGERRPETRFLPVPPPPPPQPQALPPGLAGGMAPPAPGAPGANENPASVADLLRGSGQTAGQNTPLG